ncbi:MAG: Spy/CpxP family protein refolding chaperone [Deltaproteobacteria bacterium]|nr:Spy/CpxP family protein refolding chaperone [Deltaproteobacteria bacterium]
MKTKKTLLAAMLIVLVTLGSGLAIAGNCTGNCKGQHAHFGIIHTLKDLDLTSEQKTQVKAIIEKYGEQHRKVSEELRATHAQLQEAMFAEQTDEEQIRSIFREAADSWEEEIVGLSGMIGELKKVLTPEQLEKLKDFHTNRTQCMQKFMEYRKGRIEAFLDS